MGEHEDNAAIFRTRLKRARDNGHRFPHERRTPAGLMYQCADCGAHILIAARGYIESRGIEDPCAKRQG